MTFFYGVCRFISFGACAVLLTSLLVQPGRFRRAPGPERFVMVGLALYSITVVVGSYEIRHDHIAGGIRVPMAMFVSLFFLAGHILLVLRDHLIRAHAREK